ncbi:MAG TPA: cyclic nucleotide-binding domain-containing protein [Bryobacteraceae bacterium]|nr:cyclic nucleotide-binding domain-containing protein [Bryobacteraceae bacterium]
MTLTESVHDHAFTAGLTEGQLARLSDLAHEVEFAENELVLRAREQSKNFYLLLSGSVCVEVAARSYTVCIQALGPGDAFGWSALLDHHDTLFQVRARQHSTALCLDGERLTAALQADPELAAEILRRTLKLVAGRVQATEARLGELCGVRIPKNPCPSPA